jgi:hypothetical protein
MTEGKDNAFPHRDTADNHTGLTKREYFAAMAMQGWLASFSGVETMPLPIRVSEKAVAFADALIEELNRTTK